MDELIDELRSIESEQDDAAARKVVARAVEMLETQGTLLAAMGQFVEQYRDEFEENLSYEEQEQYREYFGLEHASLGESLYGDEDDER